jgi:hypothetical protein
MFSPGKYIRSSVQKVKPKGRRDGRDGPGRICNTYDRLDATQGDQSGLTPAGQGPLYPGLLQADEGRALDPNLGSFVEP